MIRILLLSVVLLSEWAHAQFYSGCRPYTSCTLAQLAIAESTSSNGLCFSSPAGPAFAYGIDAANVLALGYDTGSTTCPRSGFESNIMTHNTTGALTTMLFKLQLAGQGASPAAITLNTEGLIDRDSVLGKYWIRGQSTQGIVPVDIGGGKHPVLEAGMCSSRVGAGMTACPVVAQLYPDAVTGGAVSNTCTAVAAATSVVGTSGRYYRSSTTLAVANSIDRVSTLVFARPIQGLRHCTSVRTGSVITSVRLWVGQFAVVPTADLPVTSLFGFRFSTAAGDTAWQLCSSDGAAGSCVTTGVTVNASTEYVLCADYRRDGAAIYGIVQAEGSNAVGSSKATNLPAQTTSLLYSHSVEALAASAREFGLSSYSVEAR